LAVTAVLNNGVLTVIGDNDPNRVVIRPNAAQAGGYSVDGVAIQVVNRNAVTRIEVSTMQGDDYIDLSLANVPSTIYAGKGNDSVTATMLNDTIFTGYGNDTVFTRAGDDFVDLGPDNDVVYTGKGNDTAIGAEGDDRLFGDLGNDNLDGGPGNDQLFGGTNDGQDRLTGGTGYDRFLVPVGEDVVTDLTTVDARINFSNNPAVYNKLFLGQNGTSSFLAGAWDNAQIERVAEPLANLQQLTGNTRLLKTASRGELTLLAVGPQISGNGISGWNSGTEIAFVNVAQFATPWLQRVVYHEIGHNWDDVSENQHVAAFRQVSGWIVSAVTPAGYTASDGYGDQWSFSTSASRTFARDYGRTNPLEDMATTWEAYCVNRFHGGSAALSRERLAANSAKWATLDRLFSELAALA
jgi:Ca2+-binding RTX toxin-like protein